MLQLEGCVCRTSYTPLAVTANRDKAPIKGLYRDFKSLEKRFGLLREGETAAASSTAAAGEATGAGIPVGDLESTEAEKDRVKGEIQAWKDDFEAREGRPALEE